MADFDLNKVNGKDWGKNPIILPIEPERITEYRPIEIHHKADGAIDDKPSFAILMYRHHTIAGDIFVVGQLSLDMLSDALDKCGYKITPK